MTLSQGTAPGNKHSTKYDFHQQFSQPPAVVTDAAPTARRRGAGKPQTSAEAVMRPPLPVQKQGGSFRGTGNFCMRTGSFRGRTGTGGGDNAAYRPTAATGGRRRAFGRQARRAGRRRGAGWWRQTRAADIGAGAPPPRACRAGSPRMRTSSSIGSESDGGSSWQLRFTSRFPSSARCRTALRRSRSHLNMPSPLLDAEQRR